MDYSAFDSLMIKGITEKWILFGVLAVIAAIHEIYYVHHKFKSKKDKNESKNIGIFLIIAAAIVFVIKLDATWFMVRDVVTQNYVEVHGEYRLDSEWSEHAIDRRVYITSDDGKEICVKFPGYTHKESSLFPSGTYNGTVWYAEKSNCIVKFVPD